MNDLTSAIFLLMMVGGIFYFWYKCQMFAVSKTALFLGLLMWPVGVMIGIYWAIKDVFVFRNFSRNDESKNDHEKVVDEENKFDALGETNYSMARDKYKNDRLDKNLYTSLLSETDGSGDAAKKYNLNDIKYKESNLSLDEAYLQALDEYESKDLDRALFARLLAENDGKEEVVKARYIKMRAEKLLKN